MTQPRRLIVAINPAAGFGKHSAVGHDVVKALEAAGYWVTSLVAESYELLHGKVHYALKETPDCLVVVGGDGMVSLAVNAVAQTSIPFAVVSVGTGNDFARGVGLPFSSPEEAIARLLLALRGEPSRIDLGRVSQSVGSEVRWFANIYSAGLDALVNQRANTMRWPRGPVKYTLALILELLAFHPRKYKLSVDGQNSSESAMLIAVANNTTMGGGMIITPDARIYDGQLDLFLLRPLSKLRLLRLFPRVFSGTHTSQPEVLIQRCKSVTIDAPEIIGYADGEPVGPLPAVIEIVPGAARVYL